VRRIDLNTASVARADTVGSINRQLVLNYVRERQPISRAELAAATALQRSTISRIVDALITQGLIEEGQGGESSGGRPPSLLRLRAAAAVVIGVDLATTRTVVATSDLAGRVLDREEFVTSPNADKTLKQIITCIRRLMERSRQKIEEIGISVPGIVDAEAGVAIFVPFFKWRNWAIGKKVSAAVGLPVTVDNDANAAALAELWFGRPEVREVRDFVMVLVEEGIGTGIVFDGQVYRGENGAAGETGHMIIGSNGPIECASGSRACWESFASERAALARYVKLARGPENVQISFAELMDRALQGEMAAQTALIKTAHYIGIGISNIIKCFSPKAVIVSGNMTRVWSLIEEPLKAAVEENSICRGLPASSIIPSTLGEQTRLMGTFSLTLGNKFASFIPT
jgi:predicted NBD/HSP70 family sugar kinase